MRFVDFDGFRDDYEKRIEHRRRVFEVLGISRSKAMARTMARDLRTSLLSCIDCPAAARCELWLESANPGVEPPAFCPVRECLNRLVAA